MHSFKAALIYNLNEHITKIFQAFFVLKRFFFL